MTTLRDKTIAAVEAVGYLPIDAEEIGPGCDHNGVDADLSWGLARRIAFPYSIANVTVLRVVPR